MQKETKQALPAWAVWGFMIFLFASLLTPLVTFSTYLFPYITSKAFLLRICIELALPFYVYLLVARPQLRPNLKNPLTISLLAFFAFNVISAFAGIHVMRSIWGNFERMGGVFYLAHLILLHFYILLLGNLSTNRLQWFLRGVLITAGLVTLNGFSGWLGGPTVVQDPSLPDRVSSTLGNPIFFASMLVVPLTISVYLALSSETKPVKSGYVALALFFLWGIVTSGTRGALVGTIGGTLIALFLAAFLSPHRRQKTWAKGLGVVFLGLVVAGFLLAEKLPQQGLLHRLFNLNDANSQARLIQWNMAWKGFQEKPVFGVGSENYYQVANKYHDPELMQYDRSWFDKPHNYFLEILVTNGLFGFAAYLAVLVLVVYAIWKAYRAGLVSAGEFAVLIGGFAAYNFQNLFVFDTVSASVMFYVFCGLAGYCLETAVYDISAPSTLTQRHSPARGAFAATAVVMLVVLFYANIRQIQAGRDINLGFAYGKVQPKAAAAFFDRVIANRQNFDPTAFAIRYSDYVQDLTQSKILQEDPDFVLAQTDKATVYQRQVTEKIQNDPGLWISYAADLIVGSFARKQAIGQEPKQHIERAIELAPRRPEGWFALYQYESFVQDRSGVLQAATKLVELDPTNMRYRSLLASALFNAGKTDEAMVELEKAVQGGYSFKSVNEFSWALPLYEGSKNYALVVQLLEKAVAIDTSNFEYYLKLARAYRLAGDSAASANIEQLLVVQSPNRAAEIREFINAK